MGGGVRAQPPLTPRALSAAPHSSRVAPREPDAPSSELHSPSALDRSGTNKLFRRTPRVDPLRARYETVDFVTVVKLVDFVNKCK